MTGSLRHPFRDGPLAHAFQIYAPSVIYSVGLGAITPAIASAAIALGVGLAVAAATVTLVGLGSLISTAPAALVASRFGERRTIIASAWLGTAGALLGWATVTGWLPVGTLAASDTGVPADGPDTTRMALYMLAILMVGAAGAGFNLARQSYLAVAVPITHRARAMSTLGGTIRIGLFAGPFIGAALQTLMGLPGAFAAGTACMLAAAVICFAIRDLEAPGSGAPGPGGEGAPSGISATPGGEGSRIPTPAPTMRSLARRHWRVLASAGVGVLCLSAARSTRTAVVPLWAEHLGLSPATASLIYGLSGFVDLIMFYPSGLLMDRKGRRVVAVSCLGGMTVAMALVPLTGTPWWFMASAMLIGLGNGFGSGIVMTLGADYSPEVGRPKFLGLWRLLSDSGVLAGPALLSVVTAAAGLAAGIWAVAVVCAVGTAVFAVVLPKGPGPVGGRGRDSAPVSSG